VFSRRLDVRPLVSHRFSLAETNAAIDLAGKPTSDSLKIFVNQGFMKSNGKADAGEGRGLDKNRSNGDLV